MNWLHLTVLCLASILSACGADRQRTASGYVEGEYVYVAAPEGGWLTELLVKRGQTVKYGDALFTLDAEVQLSQHDQAQANLAQANAQLANLQKGRRPDEIMALESVLKQASASLVLAEADFGRALDLKEKGFVSQAFLDGRRTQRDSALQLVGQAKANLALASKGAREDEIAGARAAVKAAEAAVSRANYLLEQRRMRAKVGGRIEDTLRNRGEYVASGGAVVQILPPENVRVRFFVPEVLRSKVTQGELVDVRCDGCGEGLKAKISFLSTTAEYTPPVIYSVGSREKLVWLVEAKPEPGVHLSPGQPVDVVLP